MKPIRDLTRALTTPFLALFVVGLCFAINAMTFNGRWWVQWVALGMGIATVVALAKVLRTLLVLALMAGAGWLIYRRFGAAARSRFDAWAATSGPAAAEVLRRVMSMPQR